MAVRGGKVKNKLRLMLSFFMVLVGLFLLVESILLAEIVDIESAVILIIFAIAIFILSLVIAICIDYSDGIYECPKCNKKFKPTLKAYIAGAHTFTARRLKCPECGKKSFCKRKID